MTFAAQPKGLGGMGHFDQALDQGSLVLYLTCCMECGKPYKFSFEIENPTCMGNEVAPLIEISANNENSKVAIKAKVMMTTNSVLEPPPLGAVTLNPQPSTLNPQPSTLNPTPYTLHPTP